MKTFKDIKVGDTIIACDEYAHDYNEHLVKVESIDYDEENGMTCYGTDLEEEEWGDDYVSVVTAGNFVGFYNNVVKR